MGIAILLTISLALCMWGFYLVGQVSERIEDNKRRIHFYKRISDVLEKHNGRKNLDLKECLTDVLDTITEDVMYDR